MAQELELPDELDANELNPRRSPAFPASLGELLVVGKEMGATSVDLARLFGVSPRTVRAAMERVGDDQLQAIRRVFGMVSWMKGHRILDGMQDELLRRIENGELSNTDKDGRYRVSTPQLLTMQAIQVDKKPLLAEDAKMSEARKDGGVLSSFAALLATQAEMADALRVLPEGVRRRVQVTTTVEEERQGAAITPVPFEEL